MNSTELAALRDVAFRVARKHVGDKDMAEDVAQEVMITVLRRGLDGIDDAQAFVATIARNAAIDAITSRKRTRESLTDDVGWIEEILDTHRGPAGQATLAETLRMIVAPLSERQRDVFLAYLDGIPQAEIADRFGYASAAAVAVTLTRIRRLIRGSMDEPGLRAFVAAPALAGASLHLDAFHLADSEASDARPLDARAAALAGAIRVALGIPTREI